MDKIDKIEDEKDLLNKVNEVIKQLNRIGAILEHQALVEENKIKDTRRLLR